MRECMEKDWNMMEKRLVIGVCFLAGIVFGFMMSPVKKGIYCVDYDENRQAAENKKDS